MRIYGVDFTSAPRRAKPITCAAGWLAGDTLHIEAIHTLVSLDAFEGWLASPGPWVAGFDFPFGQPRRLIAALEWPPNWADYMALLSRLPMPAFEALLRDYRDGQPPGDKHHLRPADRRTGAISPMMLYGVPVGRMFLRGAPRLLDAGVSVLPCHPTGDSRTALEVYPGLVARRWIGRASYKAEAREKQTPEREAARRALVTALTSDAARAVYGVKVAPGDDLAAQMIADPKGDALDAVLCTLPAAWAYARRAVDWGIPAAADPLEGWIVDPALIG
jgi:hypothetical protein